MRAEHEGGAPAWLAGTLAMPGCSGTQTASTAGVMALSVMALSFLEPLVAGNQKASLGSLSPLLHQFRHLEETLASGFSLLFSASGT